MKKVVLKLEVHDDRIKQEAMKKVSGLPGVDSVSVDIKDKKLTVTGDIDPVKVVAKLRKLCRTEIVSVGPAKEEKKKEEPKKEEAKKDDKKKDAKEDAAQFMKAFPYPYHTYYQFHPHYQYPPPPPPVPAYHSYGGVEEDPNSCVIC